MLGACGVKQKVDWGDLKNRDYPNILRPRIPAIFQFPGEVVQISITATKPYFIINSPVVISFSIMTLESKVTKQ